MACEKRKCSMVLHRGEGEECEAGGVRVPPPRARIGREKYRRFACRRSLFSFSVSSPPPLHLWDTYFSSVVGGGGEATSKKSSNAGKSNKKSDAVAQHTPSPSRPLSTRSRSNKSRNVTAREAPSSPPPSSSLSPLPFLITRKKEEGGCESSAHLPTPSHFFPSSSYTLIPFSFSYVRGNRRNCFPPLPFL